MVRFEGEVTVGDLISHLQGLPSDLPVVLEHPQNFRVYKILELVREPGALVIAPGYLVGTLRPVPAPGSWQEKVIGYIVDRDACAVGVTAVWDWINGGEPNNVLLIPYKQYLEWAKEELDLDDMLKAIPDIPDPWLEVVWGAEMVAKVRKELK